MTDIQAVAIAIAIVIVVALVLGFIVMHEYAFGEW
jgi:hypothetical protein